MSPALANGFFTAGSPGRPPSLRTLNGIVMMLMLQFLSPPILNSRMAFPTSGTSQLGELTGVSNVCVSHSVMSNSLQPHGLYSPPGSSAHGILQARILEWVAIPFSGGSSQPRDQTWVSHIAGRLFII